MAKRTCSIDGCEKPSRRRGWCEMHYCRWRRHGTTDLARPDLVPRALATRFWEKVDFNGPVPGYAPHLGKCWIWTGHSVNGYGGISLTGSTSTGAHRVSHELFIGPIAKGLHVDHLCRVPLCVNPAHLEAVPPRVNLMRGVGPSAVNATKTHCPQGHPYDAENTYRYKRPDGGFGRKCRQCQRDRDH